MIMDNDQFQKCRQQLSETIQGLLLALPCLAELLLWIPFNIEKEQKKDTYAYATRSEVFLQPSAFDLNYRQLAALIVHEAWHIALQHVSNCKKLNAHPLIANVAMDMLINEGLKCASAPGGVIFELPPGGIDVEWVETTCGRKLPRPWYEMSWYEVYLFLVQNLPRSPNGMLVDTSYLPPSMSEPVRVKLDVPGDLDHQDTKEDGEDTNEEVTSEQWSNRLERMRGSDPGGFLTHFRGLLPKPSKIGWPVLLRRYMTNWSVRYQSEYTFSRLHRRSLTGVVPYILPSLRPQIGLTPVTVVFDTSGSISDNELFQFTAEVDKMRADFDMELEMWVIMADCRVQEVAKLPEGSSLKSFLLRNKIHFKGRGGTSFIPALTKARELGTKLCIYFTDLEGDWGEKPKGMDVIWVVVGNPHIQPDFGKIVHIDHNK